MGYHPGGLAASVSLIVAMQVSLSGGPLGWAENQDVARRQHRRLRKFLKTSVGSARRPLGGSWEAEPQAVFDDSTHSHLISVLAAPGQLPEGRAAL